jgi:hypothetical protein
MSFFPTLNLSLQNHYKSFRVQYQCTALLLAIAAAGTVLMAAGIHWHKYLIAAIVLLITVGVSGLLLYRYKTKVINEKKFSLGWQLLLFACACLLLCGLILLGARRILPLTSLVLLFFTLLSQIAIALGLIVLAWPAEKQARIRAFIDSHIIVLALLVMAWTKGLHLWNLNLFETHHQYAYFYFILFLYKRNLRYIHDGENSFLFYSVL